MGKRVTVAYESPARERAAHRKHKLRWHRSGGGLCATSKANGGEYVIVRQRANRRSGMYPWCVNFNGSAIGSAEHLAAAKKLATHYEVKQSCATEAAPVVGEERRRGGSYRDDVVRSLKLMGQSDAETFADRHFDDISRYELAGVEPNVAAAILTTSGMHKHLELGEGAVEEGRAPTLEWIEMGDSQFPEWRATHGRLSYEIVKGERGWYTLGLAVGGGAYHILGTFPTLAAAKKAGRDEVIARGAHEASEAPTRGEWEVIVSHPPKKHRGAILAMGGPGYGRSEGDKIILSGFYDDEEARHVANSISRKYGARYGTSVSYGPRRSMAAEDSHPGVVAEERRRPGAHRGEKEEDCEHGCPTGECKPFTKLSRDPVRFNACMKRAKEIGELNNSRKMYELIRHELGSQDREVFGVLCIDFRGQLRDFVILSVGQRHRVAVDIEDILQVVILSGCDGFCVCHSHPSGNAEPSDADKKLTKSIEKAAATACPNIKMIDHIVCGNDNYFSFADRKHYRNIR